MGCKAKITYLKKIYVKYRMDIWANILLIVCLAISQIFLKYSADDLTIKKMLENGTILSNTWQRYLEWEGSWLAQSLILFIIIKNDWAFKVINILMCILIVKSFSSIMPEVRFRYTWSVLLFLAFPIGIATTAGVIVTSVAYLWVAACLIYTISITIRIIQGVKVKSPELILGIAAILFGTNREQSGLFFLFFSMTTLIYMICKGQLKYLMKNMQLYLYLQMGLTVINFMSVVLAPGLVNKKMQTIAKRYPDFNSISVGDKLYQGISVTLNFFLIQKHFVVLLFTVLLAVMVWKKWKDLIVRIISIYPVVYLICAWVKPWKHLDFLFEESGAITSQNVSRLVVYIPIILQIVWIGCAVAALYLVFENSREFWILLSALAGGFITVAALGFTGSIYASGSRINIFFYMVLIAVTLYLLCKEKRIMESGAFIFCAAFFAGFNTMNYVLALMEYDGHIAHWISLY